MQNEFFYGILPVHKKTHVTSFHLVHLLRKRTQVEKIGHAGTLDPFATGVMILLIGRAFTRLADQFLHMDKEYRAILTLGKTTDSYDIDGQVLSTSPCIPTLDQIQETLTHFQGECEQIPPMFSAKKQNGQKLYHLARKGITIERPPIKVTLQTSLIRYEYPYLEIHVVCSKGTYIRSMAQDIGQQLGCGAFLSNLTRTRSGNYTLSNCIAEEHISDSNFSLTPWIQRAL